MDLLTRFLHNVPWEQVISTVLRIAIVVALLWVAMAVARVLLRRFERRLVALAAGRREAATEAQKRAETIARLLRQGVLIVIWATGVLIVLREIGIEIAPVLASVGVVSLAVGFGAQNLVKDVIAGFFMIVENQVRVGDVVQVNGTGGLVEQINFRTLVLRDLHGTVHVFPNGNVNTLSNMTQEWSAFVFDIRVDYREDVDRAIDVIRRVGAEMRADDYFGPLIIADMEIFGVDDFAESAMVVKGRFKTLPIRQWEVGREFRRRLKKAFDREGIRIPLPQRTLEFAQGEPLAALAAALGERAHAK